MIRLIEITYDDETTEFSVKHNDLDLFTFLGMLDCASGEARRTTLERDKKSKEATNETV